MTMRPLFHKRLTAALLAVVMVLSLLPGQTARAAASGGDVYGSITATLRIDYAQSLDTLAARNVQVEVLQGNTSLRTVPLTDFSESDLPINSKTSQVLVSARSRDGGDLGGGSWPGYLDLELNGLPLGTYTLRFTGRGYVPFSQSVTLSQYAQHVVLGTGDGTFTLGDVNDDGQVNAADREALAAVLQSQDPEDLKRYDLSGDGLIDIVDLAYIDRQLKASGGAEVIPTALLYPPILVSDIEDELNKNNITVLDGDLSKLFLDTKEKKPVKLTAPSGKDVVLPLPLSSVTDMTEIQIVPPAAGQDGAILTGEVVVEDAWENEISIPFDYTTPEGVHAITRNPDSNVITINLGKRVPVKKITITVVKTQDGKYAAVESIQFLQDIVPENPNKPYDMMEIIRTLADNGEVMEYQQYFARNIITAFIRLNGKSVGVIASQPKAMAGCLDINAADKASRFIRTCDSFNIPLLTLEDVPGFLPGTQQEHGGIIRHGAKMLYAYSEASVPKVTVITRKAYGGAYIGMCSKHLGADMVFAWPDAEIAVMGADGAANIIFAKDIKTAADPAAQRKAKIAEYQKAMMTPYVAAARGYVDDVILPSETRKRVISAFEALAGKRVRQLIDWRPDVVHSQCEFSTFFLARRIALKGNYTAAVKRTFKAKEGPQTRMAMYQLLDEAFRSAQEYSEKEKKDYDEGKEVLCRVLRREIPLIMAANTALEAESVVKLGRRYGLRLVIAGAFGVEDFAQEIMDQGWHVMLGDGTNMMAAQENHTDLRRLLELSRKGLDLSIYSSGDEGYAYGYEQIWWNAAQMSAAGAAGWEIMDMMTIRPARALGVDALAGSLEPGKQADIILCRGCPAERFDNYIDQTIVAGRTVFKREAD